MYTTLYRSQCSKVKQSIGGNEGMVYDNSKGRTGTTSCTSLHKDENRHQQRSKEHYLLCG